MRPLYRVAAVTALLALLPLGLSAQDLKIQMPAGWTQVTAGVTQTAYGPVPDALLQKVASSKMVALDPQSISDGFAANMIVMTIDIPKEAVDDQDTFFKGVVNGMVESFPKGTQMADKTTFMMGKSKVLRTVFDLTKSGDDGKIVRTVRTMQYYIIRGSVCYAFIYMARMGDFGKYGATFQTSFQKSVGP
jgi:hypothetical protein